MKNDTYRQEFIQTCKNLAYKNGVTEQLLFRDWVSSSALFCSAIVTSNFNPELSAKREKTASQITNKYSKEVQAWFLIALHNFFTEMEQDPRDILGEIYMTIGAGDKGKAQFFTPFNVAGAMNTMNEIKEGDSVMDPSVGSGVMLVAAVKKAKELGYNLNEMEFYGQDLDELCCFMAFLQMEALEVDAVICNDDTLTDPLSDDTPPEHMYVTSMRVLKVNAA